MRDVILLVSSLDDERERFTVEAMKTAIASTSPDTLSWVKTPSEASELPANALICPLTLKIPPQLQFPGQSIYQAALDILSLRDQMNAWGYATGTGDCWLPVVWTEKGPLYGEVIGLDSDQSYRQPLHLSDSWRQPLYRLAHRLLKHLQASPSVYLLQFRFSETQIEFDRLWPYPAMPALASVGVQIPDLYTCHWLCLLGKPIRDLTIIPSFS